MSLSLAEFRSIGHEQRLMPEYALPVQMFTWAFGPVGLHSRIRAGHVIRAIRALELPKDAKILDAGCGHALVLFWLANYYPGYRLHGIDHDAKLIAQNRSVVSRMTPSPSLSFEEGDLLAVGIEEAAYDLVFSIDVLEHIQDDTAALRRLGRALKPDGVLILHLPLRHQEQRRVFPGFANHTVEDHVRDEYLPEEVEAKLQATGFEVRGMRYGFGWAGETAFELNSLFWNHQAARALAALITYPVAWALAHRDIIAPPTQGNSLVVEARPRLCVG